MNPVQPVNGATERPIAERLEAYRLAEDLAKANEELALAADAKLCGISLEEYRAKIALGEDPVADLEDSGRKVLPDPVCGGVLLDTKYQPIEFACDPIAPRQEVIEWTGPHAVFKSTLALHLLLCIATGRRFAGLPVRQGQATFITAEDSERTVAFRVRAWLESIPVGAERAAATAAVRLNFWLLAREHVRGLSITMMEDGEPLARRNVILRLRRVVLDSIMVFIETAARLAEGDENSNRVQAAFAQAVEDIAIESGAAVGIVRHVGKAAAREGSSDSYAGRGGGAFSDAARSVVNFTRPGPKNGEESDPMAPVVMTHAKSTHSEPARKITWQPVKAPSGGVYLRPLSDDEEARADARKLLSAIPPEGLTSSDLHKRPPAGLSRGAAKQAMALLVTAGTVLETKEDRARNKGVSVYRLAGGSNG